MPKRNQAQCGQDAFTSFRRREDRERERKASFSRPAGHSAAAHRPPQGSLRRLTIVVLLHLPAVGWPSPLPPHSDKEVQLICKLFSPQITETEPSSPFLAPTIQQAQRPKIRQARQHGVRCALPSAAPTSHQSLFLLDIPLATLADCNRSATPR